MSVRISSRVIFSWIDWDTLAIRSFRGTEVSPCSSVSMETSLTGWLCMCSRRRLLKSMMLSDMVFLLRIRLIIL